MQKLSTFLALSITTLLVGLFVTACAQIYPVVPQAQADARHAQETAEAVVMPTVTATLEPTAVALETIEAPQVACEIKGNVSGSDRVYHLPGGVYYDRVKVEIAQGDMWFCDEQSALDAGFRKSSR